MPIPKTPTSMKGFTTTTINKAIMTSITMTNTMTKAPQLLVSSLSMVRMVMGM